MSHTRETCPLCQAQRVARNSTALFRTTHAPFLLEGLRSEIDRAVRVEIVAAFVHPGGLALLLEHLRDLFARGGTLQLIAGAAIGLTSPFALRQFLDLQQQHPAQITLHAVEPTAGTLFHPKAYLFHDVQGPSVAFIGSANLTRNALTRNHEWMLRLERIPDEENLKEVQTAIQDALRVARPIEERWLDAFTARSQKTKPLSLAQTPRSVATLETEPYEDVPDEWSTPSPHPIQQEVLQSLDITRSNGKAAALVVMATGLGKTYLAAFDVRAWEAAHQRNASVLFVAHREEILLQAMKSFRHVHPDASIGLYASGEHNKTARIVMASVQTLSGASHLPTFDASHFDYIIVDEFHHAAAATYRRILQHFQPSFLLGLTATPDRMDGDDLLSLCGGHMACRYSFWDGIKRQLLSPLRYYGLPDDIDFTQLKWRNGRFDEEDLDQAIAHNTKRAEHALAELEKHAGKRVMAFCISQRHADFMALFFRAKGKRAVAVHSGASSAPRAASLGMLADGKLDVICSVDMFNEGVDIPSIDMVLMLRPTESPVVWLQQVGRGLRRAEGKPHLTVLDFIGNHRIFRERPVYLLRDLFAPGETLASFILRWKDGNLALPDGCSVSFDLVAIQHLEALLTGEEKQWIEQEKRKRAPASTQATLWKEYDRKEIAQVFGHTFSEAVWNQGFVVQKNHIFLLVTLIKDDLQKEHQYADKFIDAENFQWQSQNRTTQSSKDGQRIKNHNQEGYKVHLFVRLTKKLKGKPVPFTYCGQVDFVSWQGEKPITVHWKLRHLPDALRARFRLV